MSEPKRDGEDHVSPEPAAGAGGPARTLVRPRSQRARSADTIASGPGAKVASAVELPAAMGDRYEVRALAGEGGMGEVFVVHDKVLERDVALKRLRGEHHAEDRLRRFVQEARVTGRLEHPNIVPVHELSEATDQHFFTMKLVRGCSLGQVLGRLRKGEAPASAEFDLRRLAGILVSVCHAVAFAHSKGVLHRDLKPDNIMLGDFGEVVVMDWGLARDAHGPGARLELPESAANQLSLEAGASGSRPHALATPVASDDGLQSAGGSSSGGMGTMEGSIAGTPGYMAPEQARGEISRLSERSDVYALGAILYECLTLSPPHQKENSLLTLQAVLKEPVEAPSRRDPRRRIPRDLEAVAMRALAREPHRRYPSVNALRSDLECWLADKPVTARQPGGFERLVLWGKRNRELALGACLGMTVALISGLAVWGRTEWIESRDRAVKEKQVEDYLAQAERESVELTTEPAGDAARTTVETETRPAGPIRRIETHAPAAPSFSLRAGSPVSQKPVAPALLPAPGLQPMRERPAPAPQTDEMVEAVTPDGGTELNQLESSSGETESVEVSASDKDKELRKKHRPLAAQSGAAGEYGRGGDEETAESSTGPEVRAGIMPETSMAASAPPAASPASALPAPAQAAPPPEPTETVSPGPALATEPPPPAAPATQAARKDEDSPAPTDKIEPAPVERVAVPAQVARVPSAASGRRRVAMRFYELALEKDPESARARKGLARLLLAEAEEQFTLPGKSDEAGTLARRAAELDANLQGRVDQLLR